jgi:hypothetical protein
MRSFVESVGTDLTFPSSRLRDYTIVAENIKSPSDFDIVLDVPPEPVPRILLGFSDQDDASVMIRGTDAFAKRIFSNSIVINNITDAARTMSLESALTNQNRLLICDVNAGGSNNNVGGYALKTINNTVGENVNNTFAISKVSADRLSAEDDFVYFDYNTIDRGRVIFKKTVSFEGGYIIPVGAPQPTLGSNVTVVSIVVGTSAVDNNVVLNVKGASTFSQTLTVGTPVGPAASGPTNGIIWGKLGVNTATPEYELDVVGTARLASSTGGKLTLGLDTGTASHLIQSDSSSLSISRVVNGTPAEHLTISSAGNVGLSTSTPAERLHVHGGNLRVSSSASASLQLRVSNGTGHDVTSDGSSLRVVQGGSTRAVLDSSGRLGLGTSTPAATLHVNGTALVDGSLAVSGTDLTVAGQYVGIGTFASTGAELVVHGTTNARVTVGTAGGSTASVTVYGMVDAKAGALLASSSGGVGIGMTISPATNKLQVLGTSSFVGRVGINTDTPSTMLHVNGTSFFNGAVGVGTLTPAQPLHVVGTSFFNGNVGVGVQTATQPLHVVGTSFFAGNVGVGVQTATQRLHVVGTSFFAGNVGVGVQTATQPLHVVGTSFFAGNVGVGVQTPAQPLHVEGASYFNGNVGVGTQTASAPLHVVGTSFFNGRLGVGIHTPAQALHVEGTSFFAGNVSVGVMTATQPLHVVGTSYFNGNVGVGVQTALQPLHVVGTSYFNGGVGVGVQTAVQPLHVVGTSFFAGNVGVGVQTPAQPLHVVGTSFFNGNLGVGTQTASAPLHVLGRTFLDGNVGGSTIAPDLQFPSNLKNRKIVLWDDGTGNNFDYYGFGIQSGELVYSTTFNGAHVFKHNANPTSLFESMRVSRDFIVMSSTKVLMGYTIANAPAFSDRLIANGNIYANGQITAQGNVVAFSDARLKTDLRPVEGALDRVRQLTGYTYQPIAGGARNVGLIAQEVQKVLPEAVHEHGEHLTLAYGNMAALFVQAIKELEAKVASLQRQVDALTGPHTGPEGCI